MTSGFIEILIENAGVIAILNQVSGDHIRVYPTIAPPDNEDFPYVIVREVSLTTSVAKGCPPDMDKPRYEVLAFSRSFRETELVQQACRDAVDTGNGFSTDAGATFDQIYMVTREDLWLNAQGEEAGMYCKRGIYECVSR